MSKGWDSATLKKLKALTGKGLSTSEIGKRLGLTKNAVVGKLNRLGWNAKAENTTPSDTPAPKTPKAPTAKATTKKTATKSAPAKAATPKKAAPAQKTGKGTNPTTKPAPAKPATQKAVKTPTEKPTPAPAKEKVTEKRPSSKDLAAHQRIIQHSLEMAQLKPNQCRWPIGDPDSENFHFCGETVFVGKPYCYEHCKRAYQFAPPKKK